jgi:hypothetical protein
MGKKIIRNQPESFFRSNLTRTKVLQLIEKNFDAKGCKSVSVACQLPSLNHPVVIETYDFSSIVYSLLTGDPILRRNESLDLTDNPFYSKWKYTYSSEISNLVLDEEGKVDHLKEMLNNCFVNGFSGIKFADLIRGIMAQLLPKNVYTY